MGPRLRSRGWYIPFGWLEMAKRLQWGRGLGAADGAQVDTAVIGHGPSMGPRLRSRGWYLISNQMEGDFALQWGRGLGAADGPPSTSTNRERNSFNGAAA